MKNLFFMALAVIALIAEPAAATETPDEAVLQLNEGIRSNDPNLLMRTIGQIFDLNRVAVSSVGVRRWREWSSTQRKTYREVFIGYMLALYLDRFRDYEGGGLKIYKVEAQKNRARVRARITPQVDDKALSKADPIKIDFVLFSRKKNGKDDWQIIDVYFKGTISEVAGFRAQFSQLAKDEGWAGLVREMRAKKKDFDVRSKR